ALFIFFLFLLLKGIISPKFGLSLILLVGISLYFFPNNSTTPIPLQEQKITLLPETKPNIIEKEIKVEPKSVETPKKERPQKAASQVIEEEVKKYLTTVKIKGITNQNTLKLFSKKSGYNVSKNGDYTLEFMHTGSSKQDSNPTENNRFIFSGGHLIVKVNSDKCCCGSQIKIPQGLPLGKTMKTANQTLSETVESYVFQNLDIIIPMITECLPQI
ncbi:MAG: hypothetical protein ACI85O_000641, partial [Saprospiraceae bacterium]